MAAEEVPTHIHVEDEPEILGGFKQIHRGHFAPAGDEIGFPCAVARLQPHTAAKEAGMLAREVQMWQLVHGHPNILTMFYFDAGSGGDNPMIIMELIEPIGHDLIGATNRCLRSMANRVPVAELAGYFQQIAIALQHIHDHGVLHRDLNASQVLVTGPCVKLIDFGLAATIEEVKRDEAIRPLVSRCAAPETKKDDHPFAPPLSAYGPPVDLWGMGWILKEIFDGCSQSMKECSQAMLAAYDGLSQREPRRRWTIKQLEACAWMQTVAEARVMLQREHSQEVCILHSPALGPIRRFSRKFRAYALIIPETWPPDGHALDKFVLPGHDWTPLLVDMDPSSDKSDIVSVPSEDLILTPQQCVYVGLRDIQSVAGRNHLTIDLTDQNLGMVDATIIPYPLDLDCFEFPHGEVGPKSAALGKKTAGAERALDFTGRHMLHLAGVARSSADGGFDVEWVPQPTSVVRTGDLGLLPRIPVKPLGRSRRDPELARDTRRHGAVPPMLGLNRTRTEEPARTQYSPRPGSDVSADSAPDIKTPHRPSV